MPRMNAPIINMTAPIVPPPTAPADETIVIPVLATDITIREALAILLTAFDILTELVASLVWEAHLAPLNNPDNAVLPAEYPSHPVPAVTVVFTAPCATRYALLDTLISPNNVFIVASDIAVVTYAWPPVDPYKVWYFISSSVSINIAVNIDNFKYRIE